MSVLHFRGGEACDRRPPLRNARRRMGPGCERLVSGDDHAPVSVEIYGDESRHFPEGRLIVVTEKRAPPATLAVPEEIAAAAARDGLVARAVRPVDALGNRERERIAALEAVDDAEIVKSAAREHGGAFIADIVVAAPLALRTMMRGVMIRRQEFDRPPFFGIAAEIVLQPHDLIGGAGGEVDCAVFVLEQSRVDAVMQWRFGREGVHIWPFGTAACAAQDGEAGTAHRMADEVIALDVVDFGGPERAEWHAGAHAPLLLPDAVALDRPDEAEIGPA